MRASGASHPPPPVLASRAATRTGTQTVDPVPVAAVSGERTAVAVAGVAAGAVNIQAAGASLCCMPTLLAGSFRGCTSRASVAVAIALIAVPSRAHAHPGIGIVRDSRGSVYYTDLRNVWRQTPDGRRTIAVANVHTHELYIAAGDTLYGEHLWYEGASGQWRHFIWRHRPNGVVDTVAGPRPGFRDDYDDVHFARDSAGAMYWANVAGDSTIVHMRSGAGRPVTVGVVPHRHPGWLAVAASGTVYLVAAGDLYQLTGRGDTRVIARDISEHSAVPWHVRAFGWMLAMLRIHDGPDHDVGGIWAGRDGNVYVAVPGGRVVKRISPSGAVAVVARGAGDWTAVSGLTLPDGGLLLLETGADGAVRVRRVAG